MKKLLVGLLLLLPFLSSAQFTYPSKFFGSGSPAGKYTANSGSKFININDFTLWNQPTIPKGTAWQSVGINTVVNTDYIPEGVVNLYFHGITAVDTIYRALGIDSIYYKIGGRVHAIKDSTSGSTTLQNHTAGYGLSGSVYNGSVARTWIVDTTVITSIYKNGLKLNISDTMAMLSNYLAALNTKQKYSDTLTFDATYYRLYKSIDSLAALSTGGTVTSVAVTNGTGISASVANPTTTPNITITNTAPDQTVVLTSGTGISATGTYPNFTITNTSPSSGGTVTQVNTGFGVSGGPITSTGTIILDSATVYNQLLRKKDSLTTYTTRYRGDSIITVLNTKGVGTVTSVGSGYGITGGTITGSGILVFDSATVFTKLIRLKDSLTTYTTRYRGDSIVTALATKGSGSVTSVATGLGLSGGTITSTGTLLVDTASASILSRQRAANTYVTQSTTVAGFALTGNVTLATLTLGYGLTGTSYNGSAGVTAKVDTSTATTNPATQGFVTRQGYISALAAIGSSSNANGMTLSSGTLNLEPANGSFGGIVTTGTQTFGGAKTFNTSATVVQAGGAAATTERLILNQSTSATVGATVQYSPKLAFNASGWTGAAAQAANWDMYCKPIAGTSPITHQLIFASNVGVGGFVEKMFFDNNGTIGSTHLKGVSAAPTIAAGAGAGTGPTVAMASNSTDLGGVINVTTGTLPTGVNATIATITFNVAYGTAPFVQISSNNATTALLSGATMVYVPSASTTTTTFIIVSGTTALTAATVYSWVYHVLQ